MCVMCLKQLLCLPTGLSVTKLEFDSTALIYMLVYVHFSTSERVRSHEVRVRAARGLMLQSFARRDVREARDERDAELARVRRDRALLRQRLEDTEWSLCQRAGEIALLKTQLKDAQVIALGTSVRDRKVGCEVTRSCASTTLSPSAAQRGRRRHSPLRS